MLKPSSFLKSLLLVATVSLATVGDASSATRLAVQPAAVQPAAMPVHPFAAGEQLQYRASWGVFGKAGTGTLTLAPDTVRGRQALHAVFTIRGGIPGARIDERLESWMDRETLDSHRFVQRTRYPSFSRDRVREFFPGERRWTGHTNGKTEQGTLQSARALDELAFLYVARTLDLVVGQELVLDGYWKADANPVRLKVLRRETVKVPAGTFNTIVVQPIIRTSSLFAEKGEAEVYVSEAPTHEIVMLRAKVAVGTLVLRLERAGSGGQ